MYIHQREIAAASWRLSWEVNTLIEMQDCRRR